MEKSSIQDIHATQFEIQTNPVYHSKEVIPTEDRTWNDIPAFKFSRGNTLQAEISKLVMRLVRHFDQEERETDGGVHWHSMGPKLRKAFQKAGGRKFSDTDWLQHIYEGSNQMRFQYCMSSENFSLYIRAIQGHTGGNLIAPELIGHVAIPYRWKEFLFDRGCSFQVTSILKSGLIRTRKQRKKTDHLLHTFQPFGDNPDEEKPSDDPSKPRKVHFHSNWTHSQETPSTGSI